MTSYDIEKPAGLGQFDDIVRARLEREPDVVKNHVNPSSSRAFGFLQ
jgi:hypothetical protein